MTSRATLLKFAPVALLCPALALAGCSSSSKSADQQSSATSKDSPAQASSTGGKGVAAGTSGAQAGATPTTAAALGTLLTNAMKKTTSVHLDLTTALAGQNVTGSGEETVSNGTLTAVSMTENLGSEGKLAALLVDGKLYVQLPSSLAAGTTSGKPWLLASATSTNPTLATLGSTISTLVSGASVDAYNDFVAAATSVKVAGTDTVNGAPATHYSLVVDVSKIPVANGLKSELVNAGLKTVPVELWLDSEGRLVKTTEAVTVSGQSSTSTVTFSNYNAPVTITAPPADQIGTN